MKIALLRTKLKEVREHLKKQGVKTTDIEALMDRREILFVDTVTIKIPETDTIFTIPFNCLYIDPNDVRTGRKGLDFEERS
jgi:hypothetical protein